MAKPIDGWKTQIVYGSEVLEWLQKPLVFGMIYGQGSDPDYINHLANVGRDLPTRIRSSNGFYVHAHIQGSETYSYADGWVNSTRVYYHGTRPAERVIGVVNKKNEDGSLEIDLIGNDVNLNISNFKYDRIDESVRVNGSIQNMEKIHGFPSMPSWSSVPNVNNTAVFLKNDRGVPNGFVVDYNFDRDSSFNFEPHTFFKWHCLQNGVFVGSDTPVFNIRTDKSNTVTVGKSINTRSQFLLNANNINLGLIDNALKGDIYDLLLVAYWNSVLLFENMKVDGLPDGDYYYTDLYNDFTKIFDYSQYYKMFNMPLTYSYTDALNYINTGALPSDVFLYPFDLNDLPTTDGKPPEGGDDPKEPTDPDGESGIDGTPTVDAVPAISTNQLTNNNLYWLQAGQLELFITWFWQHAGEIIEADDLWNRIKGLYNDLASAIINIRYFPVDPQYIGGVSDTTNIVLSSIEMPFQGIKKLNKNKYTKHVLGNISIPNRYNDFTDYSPYTSIMLYLPFHGWVDLDIDIFVGNHLEVRCVYDYITGTIQYGIYVISKSREFLVNTVIAKMAVDIPITLQSKNDRDSAIFNNVTNAFGNLLGAGASAVSGNPIGLVMSTAGVASSGTQSAPIKTNGTIGENGAFFLPNKCAYYIKRPSYNRPSIYTSRVGFPSNQGGALSGFKGFTQVYNPQIAFDGNTNADNVTIKPLQSEIDEIYTALEKGVIL